MLESTCIYWVVDGEGLIGLGWGDSVWAGLGIAVFRATPIEASQVIAVKNEKTFLRSTEMPRWSNWARTRSEQGFFSLAAVVLCWRQRPCRASR